MIYTIFIEIINRKIHDSRLKKRHNTLSYHSVREAITAGLVQFSHIPGDCDCNPVGILSKCWGYSNVWPMMKSLVFYEGGTSQILEEDDWKIDQKLAPKTKV